MTKPFYIYILASQRNGTLYIGVTSNLVQRVWQHKSKAIEGFTKQYNVDKLMYYESCDSPEGAIVREKRLKKWNRSWKIDLIEKTNPEWRDLYEDICR